MDSNPVTSTPQLDSNAATLTDAGPGKTERDAIDTTRDKKEDEIVYSHGIKLALIMGSSYLTLCLVALVKISSLPP